MFPKMKFWGAATVGSKGQIVIPAEAREELSIKEGDKLMVVGHPARKTLMLVNQETVSAMLEHI